MSSTLVTRHRTLSVGVNLNQAGINSKSFPTY